MKLSLRKKILFVGLLLAVLASISFGVGRILGSRPDAVPVPISEVLNRAENGQIAKATITGNVVVAVDREGKKYQAQKEEAAPVAETLRKSGVEVSVTAAEASPWSGLAVVLPLLVVGGIFILVARRMGFHNQTFSFGRSGARLIDANRPGVTFSDVAGVEEAKVELSEVVEFLRYPERFVALGARIPKGVLLVGPPGTGKTLISKAVAGEAGVPFFSISGSQFVEMYVGVGASRVRDLFRQAKKSAPSIVFIDEIDAIGRQRGPGGPGSNDEREHSLNQLLVEMDGFDSEENVVVIAATNRPDVLDPALLRPGRFDRQIVMDAPDVGGRKAILEVHAKGKPLAEGVELESLARLTAGFSGADLANLMNEAAILAARNARVSIAQSDLDEAVLRVMAGPERKSRVLTEHEKSIIAYHEVGHALVMKSIDHSDPVQKISIVSRGQALGITVQTPKEDRHLLSRAQLVARMASAMGGRVAEELVFGDFTTGAQQDIEHCTKIARRMVCQFGMSALGAVAFHRGDDGGGGQGISESLASRVDEAVVGLVDEAYGIAKRILSEKRHLLVAVAEHLKKVETIDGPELDRLLSVYGALRTTGRRGLARLRVPWSRPRALTATARKAG